MHVWMARPNQSWEGARDLPGVFGSGQAKKYPPEALVPANWLRGELAQRRGGFVAPNAISPF